MNAKFEYRKVAYRPQSCLKTVIEPMHDKVLLYKKLTRFYWINPH